jgi:hypothetical protein
MRKQLRKARLAVSVDPGTTSSAGILRGGSQFASEKYLGLPPGSPGSHGRDVKWTGPDFISIGARQRCDWSSCRTNSG